MIVFLGVGKEGELPLDVAPSEDITWKIGWRCDKIDLYFPTPKKTIITSFHWLYSSQTVGVMPQGCNYKAKHAWVEKSTYWPKRISWGRWHCQFSCICRDQRQKHSTIKVKHNHASVIWHTLLLNCSLKCKKRNLT